MTNKLGKHKSAIIILTAILLYFSLLTYISYQRAPAQYRIDENTPSLVEYQDFIVLAGEEGAYVGQDSLMFDSADSSAEVFAARLSLTDLQKISVQFSVDCPEEYAGTTLHVDLYDGEAYDAPEQEFFVVLNQGVNQVNKIIDKGENAPEEAWLRIFTVDEVRCTVTNLTIYSTYMNSHSNVAVGITIVALVLLIGCLAFSYWRKERHSEKQTGLEHDGDKWDSHKLNQVEYPQKLTQLKLRDWPISFGIAVLIFALMYINLGYVKYGLNTPYAYGGGDDFTQLAHIKQIGEEGWFWQTNKLGAPYGTTAFDFYANMLMNTENIISKIIYIFAQNAITTMNVQFLFTFSLSGAIAYFVLRIIGINRLLSAVGGLTFGMSPYAIARGVGHFCLTACYFVPLSILLCLWAYQDDGRYLKYNRDFFKYKKNIAAIIISLLIANNGIGYYPVFTCMFLCVAALLKFGKSGKWSSIKNSAVTIGFVSFFFALALLPAVIYHHLEGENPETLSRSIADAELYGLKIAQLFLPINGHGILQLDNYISIYNSKAPLVNENFTAYLGVIGCIGFLISIILVFIPDRNLEHKGLPDTIRLLSVLNVSGVLYATVGGFSSLIYAFFPLIRGFNRISIFILFISLCSFAIIAQKCMLFLKSKQKKLCYSAFNLLFCAFCAFCLWFQMPTYGSHDGAFEWYESEYESDDLFVKTIENQLEAGDMVYQFPYHKTPEAGPVNGMQDYHLYAPYLHSNTLRWSYGGTKGRIADKWNEYVSYLPLSKRIDAIVSAGFKGIYIDNRAYEAGELINLKKGIEDIINEPPIISKNGNLTFYNLNPYVQKNAKLSKMDFLSTDWQYDTSTMYFDYSRLYYIGESDSLGNYKVLHPGSVQFGPYIDLAEGTYTIRIIGDNLDLCNLDVVYDSGNSAIEPNMILIDDSMISYTVELSDNISDVEFRLFNNSVEDAFLEYYEIAKNEENEIK